MTRRPVGWLLLLIVGIALAGCDAASQQAADPAVAAPRQPPPAPLSIQGQVSLEGRELAGGIQVYIPGTPHVSITGPDGRFRLSGLEPGLHAVVARAQGYEPLVLGEVYIDDPPTTRTFTLPARLLTTSIADEPTTPVSTTAPPAVDAPGRIEGEVIRPAGAAGEAGDCRIELVGTPWRTVCDDSGRFMLWSIPPGVYTLRALATGFAPVNLEVEVTAGELTGPLRVELLQPQAARGTRRILGEVRLWSPDGQRLTDQQQALVQIAGRPETATLPDSEGRFVIDGLGPGRHIVTARADGFQDAVPVEIDLTGVPQMEMRLDLVARADSAAAAAGQSVLRGQALRENDQDHSGIRVALAGTAHSATTDADGTFNFERLPAGNYRLLAQAEGFETAQATIDLAAGEDLSIDEPLVLAARVDRPRVIGTDPTDGARGVLLDAQIPIAVRFSKRMDPESVRQAIRIDPPIAFRVYIGRDLPTTDFDLAQVVLEGVGVNSAQFNTQYRMTIAETATDVEGIPMAEPYSMRLRMGGPAVVETWPADGGVKAQLTPTDPIIVRFNVALRIESVNSRTVRFRPQLPQTPQLALQSDPETGWSTLLIQQTLRPDEVYRLTLERGLRTIDNRSLDNTPYAITFRTPPYRTLPLPTVPRSVR